LHLAGVFLNFVQAGGEVSERALGDFSRVDELVIAFLFELNIERQRHMRGLHRAGHERGVAQCVGTEGDDRHVLFRIEADGTKTDAGGEIAGGAKGADANSFPSQRRGVGDLRSRHQRVHHAGKIESQIPYRHAKNCATDDRPVL
jgi:hypothetical protein